MKVYSTPEPAPSYARAWETINAESGGWVASANIEGVIPADFSGTFFRNGPGLHKVFDQELVHPIDGDGLICRLSFVKGRVHFSSRFVQTERRREEEAQGRMLFPGQMGSAPRSMLKFKQRSLALLALMRGKTPRIRFRDPSNTNVFYWGGKLLSCYETKLPHELDPFSLDTLGKTDLNGDIDWRNLSAHFRYDPLNRSLVLLSHQLNFPNTPKIKILHYDATWGLIKKDLIEVPGLSYIHDFGMTENYYIVHVTPFVVPNRKLLIRYALGMVKPELPMSYHPHKQSQFVVISRANLNQRYVLPAKPFHIFHFGQAYEDGNTLCFNAVCLGPKFNMKFAEKLWLSNAQEEPGKLWEFRVNLQTAHAPQLYQEEQPTLRSVEFPTAHPFRQSMACRYTYLMANIGDENVPFRDLVKFDSQKKEIAATWRAEGTVGEPVFMPRRASAEAPFLDAEDDGYLVMQMYDQVKHKTQFLLFDAKMISSGPLARIKLDHHIPNGFHGTFTPEVFVS